MNEFLNAILNNNLKLVMYYLSIGTDINFSSKSGFTALMIASRIGNLEILSFLINQYKDSILIDQKDIYGNTSLMIAFKSKNNEIADYLIKNTSTDINTVDNNGNTLLIVAIRDDNIILTELILKYLSNSAYINSKNMYNETALMKAVENNNINIAKKLLSNGANIDDQNIEKMSSIMIAVFENNYEMTKFLLNYNPNLNLRDIKNTSISDYKTSYKINNLLKTPNNQQETEISQKKSSDMIINQQQEFLKQIMTDDLNSKNVDSTITEFNPEDLNSNTSEQIAKKKKTYLNLNHKTNIQVIHLLLQKIGNQIIISIYKKILLKKTVN